MRFIRRFLSSVRCLKKTKYFAKNVREVKIKPTIKFVIVL